MCRTGLDLVADLIINGLTLSLFGMSLGSDAHWASANLLSTVIFGIEIFIAFGLYEWLVR